MKDIKAKNLKVILELYFFNKDFSITMQSIKLKFSPHILNIPV